MYNSITSCIPHRHSNASNYPIATYSKFFCQSEAMILDVQLQGKIQIFLLKGKSGSREWLWWWDLQFSKYAHAITLALVGHSKFKKGCCILLFFGCKQLTTTATNHFSNCQSPTYKLYTLLYSIADTSAPTMVALAVKFCCWTRGRRLNSRLLWPHANGGGMQKCSCTVL